jgi:hypothetical protein
MCLAHNRSACELNPICHWCAVTPSWDLHPLIVAHYGLPSRSWADEAGCHMISSPVNNCVDAGDAHATFYDGQGLCPSVTLRITPTAYENDKWSREHFDGWDYAIFIFIGAKPTFATTARRLFQPYTLIRTAAPDHVVTLWCAQHLTSADHLALR